MKHSPMRCMCLLPAVAVLLLTGCSQYTTLPTRAEPVSIAVAPIINASEVPQIIAPLSRNLREKLAASPNWRLVGEDNADAVLKVTVLGLEKRTMARDPEDTGRPLSFYEEIRVRVDWHSTNHTAAPWGSPEPIIVSTDHILYAQPSLVDARTSATAEAADRLTDKILQRLDWANPIESPR